MAEPYGPEHADAAQTILAKALEELLAAGLGHVEAMHAMVHFAIDTLPAFCYGQCLPTEYDAIMEAIEERLEGIGDLVPGVDIAVDPGHRH